jgi:diguanylate cyclase (GGDEF)-like protein
MPKGKPGRAVRHGAATPSRQRARGSSRRQPADVGADKIAPRPRRSSTALLVAEVERLERELALARKQMAELEARADIDPLTNLPNRRAFERDLARSLAYIKRHRTGAALLYLDLDNFKRINDRYGHAAGDEMLRAVARVLGRHVRESDIVARIGGDEFALLLWNCDEAHAIAKALALEIAIGRATAMHDEAVLAVGASVGVAALLPLDRPVEAIKRADQAMYARKSARRARDSMAAVQNS